jgi:hypothetical protein
MGNRLVYVMYLIGEGGRVPPARCVNAPVATTCEAPRPGLGSMRSFPASRSRAGGRRSHRSQRRRRPEPFVPRGATSEHAASRRSRQVATLRHLLVAHAETLRRFGCTSVRGLVELPRAEHSSRRLSGSRLMLSARLGLLEPSRLVRDVAYLQDNGDALSLANHRPRAMHASVGPALPSRPSGTSSCLCPSPFSSHSWCAAPLGFARYITSRPGCRAESPESLRKGPLRKLSVAKATRRFRRRRWRVPSSSRPSVSRRTRLR